MSNLERDAERFATSSVRGVQRVLRNVSRLSIEGRNLCAVAIQQAAFDMRDLAQRRAPRDRGTLASSISARAIGSAGLTYEVRVPAHYALPQEFGYLGKSGAGNRRHKAPSPRAIADWATRHGINPFALSRSILNKGYKGHDFLIPAFYDFGYALQKELVSIFRKELPRLFPDSAGERVSVAGPPSLLSSAGATARVGQT